MCRVPFPSVTIIRGGGLGVFGVENSSGFMLGRPGGFEFPYTGGIESGNSVVEMEIRKDNPRRAGSNKVS